MHSDILGANGLLEYIRTPQQQSNSEAKASAPLSMLALAVIRASDGPFCPGSDSVCSPLCTMRWWRNG